MSPRPRGSPRRRGRRGRPLIIYGAGGHAQVVAEAAAAAGWKVVNFVDDRAVPGQKLAGRPVLGPETLLGRPRAARKSSASVIIAIGDNTDRQRLHHAAEQAGLTLANVVHPTAVVSPSAELGTGVYVGPLGVVNAGARLGDAVIVNSAAVVEHHNRIGPFAHVGPRAALGGRVCVGALTLIGVGACVRPGITIGAGCTVGAGAAVVKDLGDGVTVTGVPARPCSR